MAEFSIDKLYSPDSATGRLGLVELRSFEMPPHSRMSLAQHLLLRSLIARFWEFPYTNKLVPWGASLHDKFMLPHFVWQDFEDITADLNKHGFDFRADWFSPHQEFRFPRIGEIHRRGINVELRQALEPWHVMGEEGTPGGAVRYVDSSMERIQIKASGLTSSRHLITCNGHAVPMQPTGVQGEAVAGVRYRAWQPPHCLHPTIPVHAPLVIDIWDSWNGRSLGGCTHHVKHPGGLSYETFPVNSYEAESRRLSRFFQHGHTTGNFKPAQSGLNPDFPLTLDLRRV